MYSFMYMYSYCELLVDDYSYVDGQNHDTQLSHAVVMLRAKIVSRGDRFWREIDIKMQVGLSASKSRPLD